MRQPTGSDFFIYIPANFVGHRPVNREVVEVYEHGTIFMIPITTTMHMDMASQMKSSLREAQATARFFGAGDKLEDFG